MRYPQSWDLPRNTRIEAPVELRDIMPTLLDAAGVEIPESVDGASLLSLARDECEVGGVHEGWRDFVQGEHTSCYTFEHGMQYATDGLEKYIWFHHTGRQQFFDLREDPGECRDLAASPAHAERVELWRKRLADLNERRGDPRGRDGQLVPQPDGALSLSPNYARWKERADVAQQDWRGA
jgi:arylsulfatase A-like enzyme